MEEVTKCRYIDCVDIREKEQILHELPVCDTSLCVRWLINSGHVDLIGSDLDTLRSMKFFVCNNHFTDDCYLSKGTLKENAVPSPHWSAVSRTLRNLKARRQRVRLNGEECPMEENAAQNQRPAEQNSPSEFEVDQWCRTCATKKENLVSMTSEGKSAEDMSLLAKLKLLIEVDDEDALPTKMCDECVDKLEHSFKFFQQIYVADNTLRHVFPNTRTSGAPRKPLQSIGEHMRNQQKEKEEETTLLQRQQQQQEQDRAAPKVARGIFRRGRGRPRTRGYAARARSRQRNAQMQPPVQASPANYGKALTSGKANENPNVTAGARLEVEEERQGDTVFSLLTDTCHSDEELAWSDVLKVMNDQRYRVPRRAEAPSSSVANVQTKTDVSVKSEAVVPAVTEASIKPETEASLRQESDATSTATTTTNTITVTTNASTIGTPTVTATATATATSESEVAQHVRCEFCDESFKLRRQLQTHLSTAHSQLSGHMCTDCLTCYESESLLWKHREMCHGERRYRCEHCQQQFVEKRTLREHVNKCRPSDVIRYSCDSCGRTFAAKQALVDHTRDDHATKAEGTPSKVKEPGRGQESRSFSFASPSAAEVIVAKALPRNGQDDSSEVDKGGTAIGNDEGNVDKDQEKEKDRDEEARTVQCPDCSEKTRDTVELSIHRMRRHSLSRKDATCLLCDSKSFPSVQEYEQHVLDHCKRLRISP